MSVIIVYLFVLQQIMLNNSENAYNEKKFSQNTNVFLQKSFYQPTDSTTINKKYLLGKFKPAQEKDFEMVDLKYTNKKNMFLRKECYEAFVKMHDAALKDNIKLKIISSTRTFNEQKFIWERKWKGEVLVNGKNINTLNLNNVEKARFILRYSSMPGTSRHHWGTDFDLNSLDNKYFESGIGAKTYEWLCNNAGYYGFFQPYTKKSNGDTLGYEEEKWHWSYHPLACKFQEAYANTISYNDLTGFLGSETAPEIDVIKNYALQIRGKYIENNEK